MTSRRYLQIGVAALVMGVVGYFVVRQLSWVELLELWRKANIGLLALAFAAYMAANLLRAWRFRVLTGGQLSTLPLLRAVLLQNFLNTFLPLRAGEVSYLYMVHRSGVVKPADNVASLIGARALDLVAALWIPLLTLPMSSLWSSQGGTLAWFAALAIAAALAFAFTLFQAGALGAWLERVAERRSPRLARLLGIGGAILRSLSQLRRASLLGRVTALTFACWALIYLSGYLNLIGLGIRLGFWDALFAYSFPVIASMTPVFMLGGFGVFEGSMGAGLHLVGVPLKVAMSAALLLHIAELIYVIVPAPFGLNVRSKATPDT